MLPRCLACRGKGKVRDGYIMLVYAYTRWRFCSSVYGNAERERAVGCILLYEPDYVCARVCIYIPVRQSEGLYYVLERGTHGLVLI